MTDHVHYAKAETGSRIPLTWQHPDPEKEAFALRTGVKAYLCCSQGHLTSIRTHDIRSDGTVHPSLVCPIKRKDGEDCDHVWGVLDDWQPPVTSEHSGKGKL